MKSKVNKKALKKKIQERMIRTNDMITDIINRIKTECESDREFIINEIKTKNPNITERELENMYISEITQVSEDEVYREIEDFLNDEDEKDLCYGFSADEEGERGYYISFGETFDVLRQIIFEIIDEELEIEKAENNYMIKDIRKTYPNDSEEVINNTFRYTIVNLAFNEFEDEFNDYFDNLHK